MAHSNASRCFLLGFLACFVCFLVSRVTFVLALRLRSFASQARIGNLAHDLREARAFAAAGSITPAVTQTRARLVAEFSAFLQLIQRAVDCNSCTHEHVLVFLHAHYAKQHKGRKGNARPSPTTLTNVAEMLGTAFVKMGRGQSNPARHPEIRNWLRSYFTSARDAGFVQCSAPPLSQRKFDRIFAVLDQQLIALLNPFKHACLVRDMALFAYLWATQCRVQDTTTLRVASVFVCGDERRPAFEDVMQRPLSLQSSLVLVPASDKTHHYSRAPSRLLSVADASEALAIELLYRYFMARAWARIPFSGPLFPAGEPTATTFSPTPMSAALLNATLKRRLTPIGLYDGETSYSFKRGSMQADAAAGKSHLEIALKSGVHTLKQQSKYLDAGRHLRPAAQ